MSAQHYHLSRTHSFLVLAFLLLAGCDDGPTNPPPDATTIEGTVTDEDGNPYPEVTVILRHSDSATDLLTRTTDEEGKYRFVVEEGSYLVIIELPASGEVLDTNPVSVSVNEGSTVQANFTIQLLPIEGMVVYGEDGIDNQNDIRNASGGKPESPGEPLYHANVPDELHPILAPDGHHVTLGEWRQASGTARATCNGNSGTQYTLVMDGLIPDGVYTVQAVLVNFIDGPVRVGDGALGPGGANVITASTSGEGLLDVTLPPGPMSLTGAAPGCVLTQVDSSVLWVIYQIDGQPVGGSPGPDGTAWVEQMKFSF